MLNCEKKNKHKHAAVLTNFLKLFAIILALLIPHGS